MTTDLTPSLRLRKSEKLCSQTAIDALFAAPRGKGALAYPLRAVSAPRDPAARPAGAPVQFLISVPKKRLRHAVDRVLMRRRIREAYRLNRHLIPEGEGGNLDVAFVYIASEVLPYSKIERAMAKILAQLSR